MIKMNQIDKLVDNNGIQLEIPQPEVNIAKYPHDIVVKLNKVHVVFCHSSDPRKIIILGKYDMIKPFEMLYYPQIPINENIIAIARCFRTFQKEFVHRIIDLSRNDEITSNSISLGDLSRIIQKQFRIERELKSFISHLKLETEKRGK